MSKQVSESDSHDEVLEIAGFYLGDTLCGVEIKHIQEIKENLIITKVPLAPDYVLGIMNLRGQIVTVIDEGRKIGFNPVEISSESRIIIVSSQEENIGLLVDRVTPVFSIKVAEIVPAPANIKGVEGNNFKGVVHTREKELLSLLDLDTSMADIN